MVVAGEASGARVVVAEVTAVVRVPWVVVVMEATVAMAMVAAQVVVAMAAAQAEAVDRQAEMYGLDSEVEAARAAVAWVARATAVAVLVARWAAVVVPWAGGQEGHAVEGASAGRVREVAVAV